MATMHAMPRPFIQQIAATAAGGADMRVVTVSCTHRCTFYCSSWQLVSVSGSFDSIRLVNNFFLKTIYCTVRYLLVYNTRTTLYDLLWIGARLRSAYCAWRNALSEARRGIRS